jgi:DnaK suppressor protein
METLLNDARKILEDRRNTLRTLLNRTAANEQLSAAQAEDRSDQIAADELSEVVDRLSSRESKELREIDAALKRVAEGSYGRCERCGQAIGRQRLKALPEARYCISCSASANVA